MQSGAKVAYRIHIPKIEVRFFALHPCGRSLNKKNTTDLVEVLGALPNRPAP